MMTDGSFELGYNNVPWTRRTSDGDVFYHKMTVIDREPDTFRGECIRTAREIRKSHDGEIIIPYSGGQDSEGVLKSFLLAKVRVTPLVVVYEDNLNLHDVRAAFEFCAAVKLTPLVKRVNVKDLLGSSLLTELASYAQAWELAYIPVLSVLLELPYQKYFWVGPGEASISRSNAGEWKWEEWERHYAYNKFMQEVGIDGVPSFYQWSAPMILSQLQHPIVRAVACNMYNPSIWGSSILKNLIYSSSLGLSNRTKLTGFETMLGTLVDRNKQWRLENLLCQNQVSSIDYFEVINYDNNLRPVA